MKKDADDPFAAALEDAAAQRQKKLKKREESLARVEALVKNRDLRKIVSAEVKGRMNAIAEEVKAHRAETVRERERLTKNR